MSEGKVVRLTRAPAGVSLCLLTRIQLPNEISSRRMCLEWMVVDLLSTHDAASC